MEHTVSPMRKTPTWYIALAMGVSIICFIGYVSRHTIPGPEGVSTSVLAFAVIGYYLYLIWAMVNLVILPVLLLKDFERLSIGLPILSFIALVGSFEITFSPVIPLMATFLLALFLLFKH